jgi:hypothetical protein
MLKINYVPNEPFRHIVRQCTFCIFPFQELFAIQMKPEALWFLFSFLLYFYYTFTFFALMVDGKKYSTFSATRKASLVQPISQITYKGRAEIEGVYLHSQLEHTPQLCL